MNAKQYLFDLNATLSADDAEIPSDQPAIMPLSHLAVLRVSGVDATDFLQGQTTCSLKVINDLKATSEQAASFGAFCNAKGRVISTFLIVAQQQDWLLILPAELLPIIQKRLQMYIMRAKVVLTDCSESTCLLGLNGLKVDSLKLELPNKHLGVLAQNFISLRLGEQNPRYLLLADVTTAQQLIADSMQQGASLQNATAWQLLDIEAGIPWVCLKTSEEYIPQMLNLDQLGGISFNKGCYTGQEIVARTHYLGQAKRAMYMAMAEINSLAPELNSPVLDTPNGQVVGAVLATHVRHNRCTLLVVLAIEARDSKTLTLQSPSLPLTFIRNLIYDYS